MSHLATWPNVRPSIGGKCGEICDGVTAPAVLPVASRSASVDPLPAGDDAAADSLLGRVAALEDDHATYYHAAWVALGRAMLQTDRLGRCDGAPTT